MRYAVSLRLYEYFHKIHEKLGLTNDMRVDETSYRSMLCMVDDLRTRQILHYLVPEQLEDEFHRINRIQLALEGRCDSIARTVALAGYWLRQCLLNHDECRRPNLSSNLWPTLPNRVVDLTNYHPPPFSPESRIKVVETNRSRGAYVALSYRWPKEFKECSILSPRTLAKLSQGIAACDLLSEIQDACTLAKGVGIQYLWVDALCIIQGPGGDWHTQAENMASIYMNAVFTIAVVDQTPLSVAAEKRPFVSNQQELANNYSPFNESSQESIYLWLTKSGNFVSRPLGELDHRGWVYQEQLLSSRIISLTREGVFWDCLHHSASSNRPTGILGDFSPSFQHSDNRKLKRFLLNPNALVPSEEYYWLWRKAVQSYTERELTKENDRLIALQGVTHQMALLLNDQCILGMWKKDALRSLVWFAEHSPKTKYSGVGIEGPSWSWFSIKNPVQYRLWHPYARYVDRKGEIVLKKAKILELSAKRENPLGFDRFSGKLTIVGALTEGYLYESTVYFARRWKYKSVLNEIASEKEGERPSKKLGKLKDAYTGNATAIFYIEDVLLDFRSENKHAPVLSNQGRAQEPSTTEHDRDERPREDSLVQKIHCLLLLEGGYTDMLSAHYCLILKKHEPVFPESFPEYYQRIGLGAFNTRHICVSSKEICTCHHEGYSDCMGIVKKVQIV
ncbi:heterokaryon incompatibility protein-domain-containing protein [Tricladium varicosporioides]|nr:heterokaryon incompatibility protein-domain-containing protein [Hymenoscyphus varicosporioides]